MDIPLIGLGTWNLRGEECVNVVQNALEVGYRHIDTAHVYENHQAIAKGIFNAQIDRNQLYITSKLAINEQVDPDNIDLSIDQACDKALEELNTTYLDLYLIHAPNRSYPLDRIFKSMQRLIGKKKVRQIGVSNYTIHHLQDLAEAHGHPYANQVEFHPYLNQRDLLSYCRLHQIKLVSFRPFGKGKLLSEEPLFAAIGAEYGKSGAQVILRWLIQKEIPVIPKASSVIHLRENFEVFDFNLSPEEMHKIDSIHQSKRYCRAEDPEYAY